MPIRGSVLLDQCILAVLFAFVLCSSTMLQAQCTPSCISSLTTSLGANGEAEITVGLVLTNGACNPADFDLVITDSGGNIISDTLNCNYIGQTLDYTITHNVSGNSCGGTIEVADYFPPTIHCQDTTIWCIQSAEPSDIGYPTVTDNCSVLGEMDLSYTDQFIELACFTEFSGDSVTSKIERTWTVSDDHGNTDLCVQSIYFKRATLDDLTYPLNRDDVESPSLDCMDDPMDLQLTGAPSLAGILLDNASHCELLISFSDQTIVDCSPNSINILRTWTLVDECNGAFKVDVQLIKLKDKTAPVISCPTDITVGTSAIDCTATVSLANASATDDCSSVIITPTWTYGTGYGPFNDVAIGTHTVDYIAEDDCGNRDTCQMLVTVVDDVIPSAFCAENLEIGLTNIGTAQVSSATINSSSFDNCMIDYFEVSRDGVSFDSIINFDCSDIANSPIEVFMRVHDTSGNYNECNSYIQIVDNFYPTIICPDDVNISCTDDYGDLSLTGEAISMDNCGIDTTYFTDSLNLSICNTGEVFRSWTTVDHAGNMQQCTQVIYLEDTTQMDVQFPPEFTSYVCGTSTDPSVTGTPLIINEECKDVGISYTDNVFNIAAPACYTILRNWVVVEWCTFDPNSGTNEGYWNYIQIIKVLDDEAPIVNCPSDVTVGISANNCDAVYASVDPVTGTDCNPNLVITNDSPYAETGGADASGTYPLGIHVVNYEVSDGCGNISTCSVSVTVEDATNPSVICVPGLIANLTQDGTVEISYDMLDFGSYDNCSATENLIFNVSPSIFTCDDIGMQDISLFVTDEAGNTANCVTSIEIQNNGNHCPFVNISGGVQNEDGNGLAGVKLLLDGDGNTTYTTDASGNYSFDDLTSGGSFTITPMKDTLPKNGLSTFDLIVITKHLLHMEEISSPYKLIAADIDRTGNISIFDVIELRKLLLQISIDFSNNTSWRFVKANHTFPDPTNPFEFPFPESFVISNLYENLGSANFIGIKIGDVDCTANPSYLTGEEIEVRNKEGSLILETEDQVFESGATHRVAVSASDFEEVIGCQFTLEFDPNLLTIDSIESGAVLHLNEANFGWRYKESGKLSFSWNKMLQQDFEEDAVLFYLNVSAKAPVRLSEVLQISSDLISSEAYIGDDDFELKALKDVQLKFKAADDSIKPLISALSNYPNPFNRSTSLYFELAEATNLELTIYDSKGSLIKQTQNSFESGRQELRIGAEDLNNKAGIYYIQLLTEKGRSFTQKILLIH